MSLLVVVVVNQSRDSEGSINTIRRLIELTVRIPYRRRHHGGGSGGGRLPRPCLGGGGGVPGSGRSEKDAVEARKAAASRGWSHRLLVVRLVGLEVQLKT